MPDERSKVRTENEAWPVLQQVIERLGLTRKGFLDRLADYGQARTESDYRNWVVVASRMAWYTVRLIHSKKA